MPPSIEEQLQGKTANERAVIKAQALAAAAPGNKRVTFTQAGITYVITGWFLQDYIIPATEDEPAGIGKAFCVMISASDARGPVPTDNLYRFVNPPILVPDGSGGYVENLLAAVKQIAVVAVEEYARKRGWAP